MTTRGGLIVLKVIGNIDKKGPKKEKENDQERKIIRMSINFKIQKVILLDN